MGETDRVRAIQDRGAGRYDRQIVERLVAVRPATAA